MTRLSPLVEISGAVMRAGARVLANPRRLKACGAENVPSDQPLILAVRHYHHMLDGIGLLAQVKRPLHIFIALDWVSHRATRWLMEGLARLCAWPVTLRSEELRRGEPEPGGTARSAYGEDEVQAYQRRAYRESLELLRSGRALVIFPEGFPVIDPHTVRQRPAGTLAPFKPGFARLAVAAARRDGGPVRVLPVGIRPDGHDHRTLTFVYGEAMAVTGSTDVDALTTTVYDEVSRLSA